MACRNPLCSFYYYWQWLLRL